MKKASILTGVLFLFVTIVIAQDTNPDRMFNYNPDDYDLMGLFSKKDTSAIDSEDWKKTKWSIFPAIAINPAIGTGYGFGITAGKYLGDPKTTRMSAMVTTPLYTSKGQTFFPVRMTIYTKDEKYFLNGTYIWRHFPLGTYGLGSNSPELEGDMLDSKTFTFWQTVNRKIGDGVFIGVGYALDYYYDVKDSRADVITEYIEDYRSHTITKDDVIKFESFLHDYDYEIKVEDVIDAEKFIIDWNQREKSAEEMQKEHLPTVYQKYYNEKFGKDPEEIDEDKEISSSIMLNFIIDKRDNQLNPYEGIYFNTYSRLSYEWLGSSTNYTFLAYDYRQYWEMPWLNKNILGLWATGAFTFGDPVYTGLPAIASDPFLRSGRGWIAGRLKGMDMTYAELEYRMPVYKLFGVVGFVNASNFSDINHDFGKLKLGYGLGFRLKLNKKSRSNFAFDLGWNENGYAGFYMQLNETF
ncbi:MAG: BamA/TamA family outer membrane protein [Bacteroidota bacterium]